MPTLDQPRNIRPDIRASWPRCPRMLLRERVLVGGEPCTLADWARWHLAREAHHSPRLVASAAHLLRVYEAHKDAPSKLREHIAIEKAKANRTKGRG